MRNEHQIKRTNQAWQPISGCSAVSSGCDDCAMGLRETPALKRLLRTGFVNMTDAGPAWSGSVKLNKGTLLQPMRWRRPRSILVCPHSDLFNESVPDAWRDLVFAAMTLAPQHTFELSTRRSEKMRAWVSDPATPGRIARSILDMVIASIISPSRMMADDWPVTSVGPNPEEPDDVTLMAWPLPNLRLGVAVEDQQRANEHIPNLLATPAAVRFVSAVPLLGPIDLTDIDLLPMLLRGRLRSENDPKCTFDALTGKTNVHPVHGVDDPFDRGVDWVICGGESGPKARPLHPDWARGLRDQCAAVGIPFLFKRWGEWVPEDQSPEDAILPGWARCPWAERDRDGGWSHGDQTSVYRLGKRAAGRLLDGILHNGTPGAQ
ncbi:protein gp37 [Rhodopseudomonas faecalis]|uniref:Protein gp37 n=1 Tax=Rhodopseudomonas faecalis TaxID=99655 RepID=A0A318TZB6_9BRAD|nr:DUF5131 family protein [Rhodopseudomonas faecalis]PYF04979.1 protein gp37 [Rhodopseudomonas faecalis]